MSPNVTWGRRVGPKVGHSVWHIIWMVSNREDKECTGVAHNLHHVPMRRGQGFLSSSKKKWVKKYQNMCDIIYGRPLQFTWNWSMSIQRILAKGRMGKCQVDFFVKSFVIQTFKKEWQIGSGRPSSKWQGLKKNTKNYVRKKT